MPQAHSETPHPRDSGHSHFGLRNVAVARVCGTSKIVHIYKPHAQNILENTTRIFAFVLYTYLISYIPQLYYNKLKLISPNLTCPELEPQPHCEHRLARHSNHGFLELRHVAVAQACGTSKMVHVYNVRAKKWLEHTTRVCVSITATLKYCRRSAASCHSFASAGIA